MKYTELFNDKSDIYASARPGYPVELYDCLGTLCDKSSVVWDCGCGNGQSAVDLAGKFDTIVATDISSNQIANAFAHPRISYSVAAGESSGFADAQFDLVCVAQALHWMQYDQFWPEVNRVLKADGVFATWGYCWAKVSPAIDQLVQTQILDIIEPYWAPQNALLWDHYRDINVPMQRIPLAEIPMNVEWDLNQFFAFLHSWSATRRCMDAIGDGFFNAAYQTARELWPDAQQVRQIELDFFHHVYRKT